MQKLILHHGQIADFESRVNNFLQEDYFIVPNSLKITTSDNYSVFVCEAILQKEANKIRVIKVGSEAHRATQQDIEAMIEQLSKVSPDPNTTTIVTHHAVKIDTVNV